MLWDRAFPDGRGVFEILVATPKLRDAMLKTPTIEGCRVR